LIVVDPHRAFIVYIFISLYPHKMQEMRPLKASMSATLSQKVRFKPIYEPTHEPKHQDVHPTSPAERDTLSDALSDLLSPLSDLLCLDVLGGLYKRDLIRVGP
jgi:hypothetical protein